MNGLVLDYRDRDALAIEHLHLVWKFARQQRGRWFDEEEIASMALVYIYDAARYFEPIRGLPFVTVARLTMHSKFFQEVRKLNSKCRIGRKGDSSIYTGNEKQQIQFADRTAHRPDEIVAAREFIESATTQFNDRARAIISVAITKTESYVSIAVRFDTTPMIISNLVNRFNAMFRRVNGDFPESEHENRNQRRSKLTWKNVREIRERFSGGERKAQIARYFHINPSTVHRIISGKRRREPEVLASTE